MKEAVVLDVHNVIVKSYDFISHERTAARRVDKALPLKYPDAYLNTIFAETYTESVLKDPRLSLISTNIPGILKEVQLNYNIYLWSREHHGTIFGIAQKFGLTPYISSILSGFGMQKNTSSSPKNINFSGRRVKKSELLTDCIDEPIQLVVGDLVDDYKACIEAKRTGKEIESFLAICDEKSSEFIENNMLKLYKGNIAKVLELI